jgi:hypothetical protein
MIGSQIYDGVGKLGDELAKLYRFSPKSNNLIADRIAEAKAGLGITSKAKKRTANENLALWQWHYEKLHPIANESVSINSQTGNNDGVAIFTQADNNEVVDILTQFKQADRVEVSLQPDGNNDVEILLQSDGNDGVEVFTQPDNNKSVEIFTRYHDSASVRIAFYIQRQNKKIRQVIALDGIYLNALMLATGITKADVPKWIQQAVDSWAAFDSSLPITKQVKLLLVRELTDQIKALKANCLISSD